MRLYLFTSPGFHDCFIFGRTEEASVGIYADHRTNHNDEPSEFTLERIDDKRRWSRDAQLRAALALDYEGVGDRSAVDGSWTIVAPASTPHPAGMAMSIIATPIGDELVIFAQSRERATAMGLRFLTIVSELPDAWHGDEASRAHKQATLEQLNTVLDDRIEGLGLYDEGSGWTVWPLPVELDDFSWDAT